MDQNEGLKYVHTELIEKSAGRIKELPEDIVQKIQSFDRTITALLAQKQTDAAFRYLKRREQVYLAFPTKILNISHRDRNGDKEIKKILDHRARDLISRYPEEQQPALELLVSAIRDNSVTSKGSRVQAYLYGPPGTGKTTFVKQLGEALNVPICYVSMSSLEPSQLLGFEHEDYGFSKSDSEVVGKIASCYISSGYKNPIIFFDEAGEYLSDSTSQSAGFDLNQMKRQQIQAEFKKITDPSSSTLNHVGLGIKIDTSRSTFLFASNYPLTNTALLSRITQLSLSKLTRSEKEVAATGSLEQSLCEKSEFLADDEIEEIRKVCTEYLPFIIDEDAKRNPGARTIQSVIGEFVGQVEALQEQERVSGTSRITEELLKKRILGSFERREPLPATGN
ncbi:MAG: AAA family ATPase [Myxococcota bacterium]